MSERMRRGLEGLFWVGALLVMALSVERSAWYTPAKGITTGLLVFLSCWPWHSARRTRMSMGISLGLGLSFLGDVAIDFLFLAGLVVFLLAHLAYIFGMGREALKSPQQLEGAGLALTFVLGIYFGGLEPILPDEMRLPVLCYIAAIGTMVARATGLFLHARATGLLAQVQPSPYLPLLLGAWLFSGSDALLAMARWGERQVWMSPTIMLLYYGGQFLFYRAGRRAEAEG